MHLLYAPCNCKNSRSTNTPSWSTFPVNWLLFKSSCIKSVSKYSSVGKLPDKALKSKSTNLESSKKIMYHEQLRVFMRAAVRCMHFQTYTRLVKTPTSVGMVPVRPPRSIPHTAKSVRRAISSKGGKQSNEKNQNRIVFREPRSHLPVGIVPTKLLFSNSTSVTHPLRLQTIPAQSHSLNELKNRRSPRKGFSSPQGSAPTAEHWSHSSPFVE